MTKINHPKLTVEDLNLICRICLKKSDNIETIFAKNKYFDDSEVCYDEMLLSCTLITCSPYDNLPTNICQKCIEELKVAYDFSIKCENSDKTLRKFLTENRVVNKRYRYRKNIKNKQKNIKTIRNKPEIELNNSNSITSPFEINSESSHTEIIIKIDPESMNIIEKSETDSQIAEYDENSLSNEANIIQGVEMEDNNIEIYADDSIQVEYIEIINDIESENEIKSETIDSGNHETGMLNTNESIPNDVMETEYLHEETEENGNVDIENENVSVISGNESITFEETKEYNNVLKSNSMAMLVNDTEINCEDIERFSEEENDIIEKQMEVEMRKRLFNENMTILDESDAEEKQERKKSIKRGTPYCESCDLVFSSIEVRNIKTCPICKKPVLRNTTRNLTQSNKKFKCNLCDRRFGSKFNLQRHLNLHTGNRPHNCEICGKTYIQLNSLKEHIRTHTGETPFVCDLCGKRFIYQALLTYHMSRHAMESGEDVSEQNRQIKKYPCDHCDKVYISKSALNAHKLSVNGRQFLCSYCGKGYTAYSTLKKHINRHTGVKSFSCEYCEKTFYDSEILRKHLRVHTGIRPYECNECGKAFKQANQLKYHMMTHTKEKPFECGICGKKFGLKGSLTVHKRLHTGERPYSCGKCTVSFKDFRSLRKHIDEQHGGDLGGINDLTRENGEVVYENVDKKYVLLTETEECS